MRRGTTETISVAVSGDIDFTTIQRAVMTIGQGMMRISRDLELDENGTGVCIFLPEQTIKLRMGSCRIQVKMLLKNGAVIATNIVDSYVDGDILNEDSL